MTFRNTRRTLMAMMFVGGPTIGWLLNGDRGILFGSAVSALAVCWFVLEQRKIV